MNNDYAIFVNTGEWTLEYTDVVHQTANYSSLFVESKSEYIDWPEVVFTVTLKRNPSFYIQSLIFPSFLLTTIALFGFLLPPSSGERVGLQITILLTFMVFLLTVCEMFPASTGPYLGYYYVICTFLLAVNLLMTVLVLNLHYRIDQPVPLWVKKHLATLGKFCMLDVANFDRRSTEQKEIQEMHNASNKPTNKTRRSSSRCLCNIVLSCLKEIDSSSCDEIDDEGSACYDSRSIELSIPEKLFKERHYRNTNRDLVQSKNISRPERKLVFTNQTKTRAYHASALYKRRVTSERHQSIRTKRSERCRSKQTHYNPRKNGENGRVLQDKKESLKDGFLHDEKDTRRELSNDKTTFEEFPTGIRGTRQTTRNANVGQPAPENEWKMMANLLDKILLRVYVAILIVSHAAIVSGALLTAYTIEPHTAHVEKA